MFLLDMWILLKTEDYFKLGAQHLLHYVGLLVGPVPSAWPCLPRSGLVGRCLR